MEVKEYVGFKRSWGQRVVGSRGGGGQEGGSSKGVMGLYLDLHR